jgi:hypothetical protein
MRANNALNTHDRPARIAGPSSGRRAVSHRAKITIKGAPGGAWLTQWHFAPPLTVIFPGKTSAPIRRTGQD